MARDLVYPNSDTTSLVDTIGYLQRLFVIFGYCELISVTLLNSKSCSGSFSAADPVAGADTTDTVYLFQPACGSSVIVHWIGASAVCVCTKDDYCFSQTRNYVMRLSTSIEHNITFFCYHWILKEVNACFSSAVTTGRKAMTIVLSFLFFAKPFTFQ